jgi:hypothetical protein
MRVIMMILVGITYAAVSPAARLPEKNPVMGSAPLLSDFQVLVAMI